MHLGTGQSRDGFAFDRSFKRFPARSSPALSSAMTMARATSAGAALDSRAGAGAYYVVVNRVRSDIVGGQQGLPFTLEITVIDMRTCKAAQERRCRRVVRQRRSPLL